MRGRRLKMRSRSGWRHSGAEGCGTAVLRGRPWGLSAAAAGACNSAACPPDLCLGLRCWFLAAPVAFLSCCCPTDCCQTCMAY